MSKPNLNIKTQCVQIYIYMVAVAMSSLAVSKNKNLKEGIMTLITGSIVTFVLMQLDYCNWTFQWVSWVIAGLSMIGAMTNLFIFMSSETPVVENSVQTLQEQ